MCVLFLAGAAVAQWAQDDGQWKDDTHQWNQWSGVDNGQWDGDQGGQWNPAADGSMAGQWNPAANNMVAPWAGAPAWGGAPVWGGVPGVPHDTPEVAAAKAAHLAVHAAHAHRWRRQALLPATTLVSHLAAPTLWGATHHSVVAPTFLNAHATTLW